MYVIKAYKSSLYNFLIKVDNTNYLLYNSLSNGLLLIQNEKEIELVKQILYEHPLNRKDINLENIFFDQLYINGIIIDQSTDEKDIINKRIEAIQQFKTNELFLTICPTNRCNMACPYCFEHNKPIRGKMENKIIDRILSYVESTLGSTNNIEGLNVTWYGGEPLLAPDVIRNLSGGFIQSIEKNNLKYNADIITNGVLLNERNWELLKSCQIKSAQVTIDGNKITHNKSRLLKGRNRDSYYLLLNNLSCKPHDFALRIRINANKEVAENLNEFLDDLERFNIWPQHAKTVNLSFHRRENFSGNSHQVVENFLSEYDFFKAKTRFTKMKLTHYNNWAKKAGKELAKYAFHFPTPSHTTCAEVALPNSFAIDQCGQMYKCWGVVNHESEVIQNIAEDFELLKVNEKVIKATNYNKFYFDDECKACKFLPICNVDCMWKHTNPHLAKTCCEWKYTLEKKLKQQYLLLLNHPEQIQDLKIFEKNKNNENCSC
ncbi:MAG: SPASM domain-containing protein [Bacteroidales bacterium]|nr:SPASM domain-containing protein [Bacteroidales bacterium]